MFQFRTRELLLLAIVIALALAMIIQRRGQFRVNYLHANDSQTVPGVEIETHSIVIQNARRPIVLQLQEGTKNWRGIYNIPACNYRFFSFHTFKITHPQSHPKVTLVIQGSEIALGELSSPIRTQQGKTISGDLTNEVSSSRSFYEMEWSDTSGEDRKIQLRLVYQ